MLEEQFNKIKEDQRLIKQLVKCYLTFSENEMYFL